MINILSMGFSISKFFDQEPLLGYRFFVEFFNLLSNDGERKNVSYYVKSVTFPSMGSGEGENFVFLGNGILGIPTYNPAGRELTIVFEETDYMDLSNYIDNILYKEYAIGIINTIYVGVTEFLSDMRTPLRQKLFSCRLKSYEPPEFSNAGGANVTTKTIALAVDAEENWNGTDVEIKNIELSKIGTNFNHKAPKRLWRLNEPKESNIQTGAKRTALFNLSVNNVSNTNYESNENALGGGSNNVTSEPVVSNTIPNVSNITPAIQNGYKFNSPYSYSSDLIKFKSGGDKYFTYVKSMASVINQISVYKDENHYTREQNISMGAKYIKDVGGGEWTDEAAINVATWIYDAMETYSNQYGDVSKQFSYADLITIGAIETGYKFNYYKKAVKNNSSAAGGMFQFIDSTWENYIKAMSNETFLPDNIRQQATEAKNSFRAKGAGGVDETKAKTELQAWAMVRHIFSNNIDNPAYAAGAYNSGPWRSYWRVYRAQGDEGLLNFEGYMPFETARYVVLQRKASNDFKKMMKETYGK